ncbi:hypothetical protein DITRI_Ditri02bG0021400 [Diplodiscus trichospermus]
MGKAKEASSLRRLVGLFTTSISSPTDPTISTVVTSSKPAADARQLQKVANKFKQSSESKRFRNSRRQAYANIVHRLATAKQFSLIYDILQHHKKYKEISEEGFVVRLIILYGKAGMFEHAQKLFDEMPELKCERTVKSFNALLAACLYSKKLDYIEKLFKQLPQKLGIEPNLVSYNTIIKAFCEMGSLDSASLMLDEMQKKGVEPEKRMEVAVNFVEEMRSKRLKLDVFTFNYMIRGFINEGELEGAKEWYNQIGKNDGAPDKQTYAMLVPFLCKKGDLRFATKVCKDIFARKKLVGAELLQLVVDELVKASMIEDAKELVELGKKTNFCRYKLNMAVE